LIHCRLGNRCRIAKTALPHHEYRSRNQSGKRIIAIYKAERLGRHVEGKIESSDVFRLNLFSSKDLLNGHALFPYAQHSRQKRFLWPHLKMRRGMKAPTE